MTDLYGITIHNHNNSIIHNNLKNKDTTLYLPRKLRDQAFRNNQYRWETFTNRRRLGRGLKVLYIERPVLTLCSEGLATEMALIRPFTGVHAQMHAQVGLLGERMAAEVTHERPLISATQQRLDYYQHGASPTPNINTQRILKCNIYISLFCNM